MIMTLNQVFTHGNFSKGIKLYHFPLIHGVYLQTRASTVVFIFLKKCFSKEQEKYFKNKDIIIHSAQTL